MKVQRNSWLLEADCSARGLDCTLDYSTRQWYQGDDKSAYPYCCCCCCDSCVGGILKACSTLLHVWDSAEPQNTNLVVSGNERKRHWSAKVSPKGPTTKHLAGTRARAHRNIPPSSRRSAQQHALCGGGKRWMTLFTLKQRSVWSRGRIEPCKFIHE